MRKKTFPTSKDEIGNINDSGKHRVAENIFENVAKAPMIREYLHLHRKPPGTSTVSVRKKQTLSKLGKYQEV